jgi:hypothetical protein
MQLALCVTAPVLLNSLCLLAVVVSTSFEVALEWGGRCFPAPLDVVAVGAGPTFPARSPAVVLARASAVVAMHGLIPGSKRALNSVAVAGRRRCSAKLL